MSATLPHHASFGGTARRGLRFGVESGSSEPDVQWLLKRNCSATPRQMVGLYASLSLVSLVIGVFFWYQGATLVMPFAWVEIVALGTALLVYSRHATDTERIWLQGGRLTVEHLSGRHVERAEFSPAWVRVEPRHGERSLIELSGQGQRIAVGRFVRPELRRQLADELRWAVRRWQWTSAGARLDATTASTPPPEDKSEN